ncbi:tripartite tricarboxylate transporter substrate binding protein [Variovorax sp. J22P240]|uniref:Bug family tripartite tricarboxylate transporter substrate binding protein n=1 Tax=unclassified Variovorax TaxID=663243 RepID=UPI0025785A7C|nr:MULTISPECIES: tripartite tricarboxylate transporter substrate binding protein [unclassified Variovorax]MDL9999434.1 tripartite tricarboxylate transporter substrate binding protein [Variovorax sp. J22P240]MDM0052447.1 tripartite tricarboxylate transporter substrate binding protein [Variovorax sp. J22R115]
MSHTLRRVGVLSLLLACAAATHAQTPPSPPATDAFPNRTVTIVVPFPAGGGTDLGARLLAQKLAQKWGQGVVVDNRAGAAGLVGAEMVAKAKPDGYTLLIGNVGTQSINPSLYKKMPYDTDRAFAPVSLVAELPFVMMVGPSVQAKSVKEFVALAKASPDKLMFASSGSGGSPHLTGEIFAAAAAVRMTHVPYKGGTPAMTDLMGGHVDVLFASILESASYIKAGKLRGLAVTGSARSPTLPDLPTLAEAGVPNAESGSWIGLLAPAGTPQPIVDKLAADVKSVLSVPETRQTLVEQGAVPRGTGPAELKALIDTDRARYGRVIRDKNIGVD